MRVILAVQVIFQLLIKVNNTLFYYFVDKKILFQILSGKMAKDLLLGLKVYAHLFKGCETTSEFCSRINNLFDILNRIDPAKGLRLDSKDYEVKIFIYLS